MKPGVKYCCEAVDGRIGYAVYNTTADCVQFIFWGHVMKKENETYLTSVGTQSEWIGRPTRLIAGFEIGPEWTAADQRVFDNEGRSWRDALDMGFTEPKLQLSLF